jgi:hypothetical protein
MAHQGRSLPPMDQYVQGSSKNCFFSKIFATMPSRRVFGGKTRSFWGFLPVKDVLKTILGLGSEVCQIISN